MSELYCVLCSKEVVIKNNMVVGKKGVAQFIYKGWSLCAKHFFLEVPKYEETK